MAEKRKPIRVKLSSGTVVDLMVELECLRQGFATARDLLCAGNPIGWVSMEAYHRHADRMVVALGGESVRQ
jgi:hypothetical protein